MSDKEMIECAIIVRKSLVNFVSMLVIMLPVKME